jgi:hypothetical protein
MLVNFFARDSLSGALCQEQEYSKCLRLEPDQAATLRNSRLVGSSAKGPKRIMSGGVVDDTIRPASARMVMAFYATPAGVKQRFLLQLIVAAAGNHWKFSTIKIMLLSNPLRA